ncbi:hypothetical protein KX816_05230 [Sphingosinicellaceae bacterium]|nr:hypothetical protein KX816_05230 [Sphingosinicellaceae bacterium]
MPILWGFLFGMALRRWGVIGLFTWIFGTAFVGELVGANISQTAGRWSEIAFVVGLFAWAIWRPTQSEAKLGFLRALRLLILLCMLATGAVGMVVFISQDMRFSRSTGLTWLLFGITAGCGLALFAFRTWLDRDLQRAVSD